MEFEWKQNALHVGKLYIGCVVHRRPHSDKWRAWLMTDEDGEEIGNYDAREDAMVAVEIAARAALGL